MSLPSLHMLLNTGIPVVVCARPWARDLLAGYDLAGFVEMNGNWQEDRAAVSSFRKKARHAHVRGLILPDSLSSAMVFKFAGVPSAGFRDEGRSLILKWPVKKPPTTFHAVEVWHHLTAETLRQWGVPAAPARPGPELALRMSLRHRAEASRAIDAAGLSANRFLLIAPTATGLHRGRVKVWPYFDALTRRLQDQGYTVVVCPPGPELHSAKKNAPTALCLPPLKLGAFATLTQLASLVICNDSGVSHLAAAAGARQVTLFGVTDPQRTGPWSGKALCLGSAQTWPSLEEVEGTILNVCSTAVLSA